ncbi:MAG TPA: electron transfer flavoprotein subunit alpha/FixB family protein [Syntrophorhabdaceae bacterium]|nr:electron transfer flavoprotein subunit alpha/FixB family protein [Syntrophorhabdaceae bacterium]
MPKDIFVLVECKDRSVRKASLEILSKGKQIAGKLGCEVCAVIMGNDIKDLAESLKAYADKVIVANHAMLHEYSWDTYTMASEQILKKYVPRMVLGASTVTGKDFFPRLAVRLKGSIVSDAIGIDVNESIIRIKKPLYGGKVFSWIECKGDSTAFVTFRPNSFTVEKRDLDGEIVEEQLQINPDPRLVRLSVEKTASKKVDLQETDFIICGGRGMKGPEHFQLLEEIADLSGGRVGASRSVVDSKWRDYDDQIGKSGKTVSPKLYIGCGVSGALHHIMGMDTSKVIVAINKDPKAPIFQYADYGIIDDLFTVLPVLKEELKRVREES